MDISDLTLENDWIDAKELEREICYGFGISSHRFAWTYDKNLKEWVLVTIDKTEGKNE